MAAAVGIATAPAAAAFLKDSSPSSSSSSSSPSSTTLSTRNSSWCCARGAHLKAAAAAAAASMPETSSSCARLDHHSSFGVMQCPLLLPDSRTLDGWVRGAIVEIVKHLREAPFLHFVFSSATRKPERRKVTEDVFRRPESWSFVKQSVFDLAPDGLIYVQRLDAELANAVHHHSAAAAAAAATRSEGFTTRAGATTTAAGTATTGAAAAGTATTRAASAAAAAGTGTARKRCWVRDALCAQQRSCAEEEEEAEVWGVLVQGRGSLWNACYILQTTRVPACGTACTRFCLSRAQCFGPSLQAQLEKLWLVQ